MPAQYIRQRRNRQVSRNVPRHLREFITQGQAQLKFQIIAHSVVVLLQASCLALPRVLAARHTLDVDFRVLHHAENVPLEVFDSLLFAIGSPSRRKRPQARLLRTES